MVFLEVIELRIAKNCGDAVEQYLGDWIQRVTADETLPRIRYYKHALLETDICIHICFRSAGKQKRFSSLGAQLAENLKEFGLVNHSLWLENEI